MKRILLLFASAMMLSGSAIICHAQVDPKWKIHDPNRPTPPVIDPGTSSTQDSPGRPPADAVVLFDGKDLSQWAHKDGSAAKWRVEKGYAEVAPGTGYIYTRQPFGDCQLHVEFSEPVPPKGESQERGNSGVFLMGFTKFRCWIPTRIRHTRTARRPPFTASIRRWSTLRVRQASGKLTILFFTARDLTRQEN